MKTRKWILMLLMLMMACVFCTGVVNAALVLVNDYVVRDDKGTFTQNDDTCWVRDLTMFNALTLSETLNKIDLINNDPNYVGAWGTWELAEQSELEGIRDIWFSAPNGFDQISLFSITSDSNGESLWVGRTMTVWDTNNWSEWGPLFVKSTLDHSWRGSSIFP